MGAVLHKLGKALDLQRDEDLGLAFWSGDVKCDAVKIGNDLVDVCGSSSVSCQSGEGVGSSGVGRTQRSDP